MSIEGPREHRSISPLSKDSSVFSARTIDLKTSKASKTIFGKIKAGISNFIDNLSLPSNIKVSERIRDILPTDFDYEKFKTEATDNQSITFTKRFSVQGDHPHLIFIATQRRLKGDNWKPSDLAQMPTSFEECKALNAASAATITPLTIEPEDVKIFATLTSLIYPSIVKSYEWQYTDKLLQSITDKSAYDRSKFDPSKETIIRNFLSFNGLNPDEEGLDSSYRGVFEHASYTELADALMHCKKISSEDKTEFSEALRASTDFRNINTKTVDKIKRGEFITIPVGFRDPTGGHAVTIAFYKDEFVICNRGARTSGTPIVQRFRYDPSKMNIDVLKNLIIQSILIQNPSKEAGETHQQLQFDIVLPKILEATKVEETGFKVPFKDQTIGNCSKASPMIAIKMGIYLKELEKGKSPREAAWIAKEAGDELSFQLRQRSIHQARSLLDNPHISKKEKDILQSSIVKAEQKLLHKATSRIEILTFKDILSESDLSNLCESSRESTLDLPARAARESDHPLLLIIARQRKNLGSRWEPSSLSHLPINLKKCEMLFTHIGGLQKPTEDSVLQITSEDLKIFSALTKEITKYPILAHNLGFE